MLHAVPGSGPGAPPVPRHPYGTRRRLHPSLHHSFGDDLRTVSPGRRWALPVLAAAAAAALDAVSAGRDDVVLHAAAAISTGTPSSAATRPAVRERRDGRRDRVCDMRDAPRRVPRWTG